MPSLLKDRPGRLGRLISALRPARAGPLPVQTGFPTSLADLFVQNHGRLKKQGPSSYAPAAYRRKRRGAPALPSPPPSPAPSPPPPSPPPSPPPAVCPPSTQPGLDLPRAESGLGLGFLALVGVVSLALLVIWSRKVVAAVTVAAFLLVLLESVRASSLDRRPRPRPPATTELDTDGRGYVSPIREVEAEPEPPGSSFSDSGRGIHAPILCIEERSEVGEDSCNWEAKPRKRSPWKKLIPRKLQRGRRIGKESDSLSSSFRSEVSQADSTLGGNARATDSPDSRRGRRNQANAKAEAAAKSPDSSGPLRGKGNGEVRNNVAPMEIDEPASLAGVDDVGGGGSRFPLVAVIVVVLVGLVAGRLPAVAFTVLVCGGANLGCEAIRAFHGVGASQG